MVKITAMTPLNMNVPIPTKECALRCRDATGVSFPKLAAKAWALLEAEVAKMSAAEKERYFAS